MQCSDLTHIHYEMITTIKIINRVVLTGHKLNCKRTSVHSKKNKIDLSFEKP